MHLNHINKFFQEKFGRPITEEEFNELKVVIEKDELEHYHDEMSKALAKAGVCTGCGDISGFNCICERMKKRLKRNII